MAEAAARGDDEYEDIHIQPPPAPSRPADDDLDALPPSAAFQLDDDIEPSQRSASSSAGPLGSSSSSSASSARAAAQLLTVWQNELHAPELLPYAASLMASLQSLFSSRQAALDAAASSASSSVSSSSSRSAAFSQWEQSLYQLELDRLSYALTDYHRCRLQKIEQAAVLVLSSPSLLSLLSPHERVYASHYVDLWDRVMQSEYLLRLSSALKGVKAVNAEGMVAGWEEGKHVFVRVRERVDGELVMSDDGAEENIALRPGDVWLARYEPFKQLLRDGKVELI